MGEWSQGCWCGVNDFQWKKLFSPNIIKGHRVPPPLPIVKKQMPHKCLDFLDEHFLLIIYNRVLKNWARDKSPISDTEFHLRSAIPNKSEFMDTHPESLILKFCQLGLSDRLTVCLSGWLLSPQSSQQNTVSIVIPRVVRSVALCGPQPESVGHLLHSYDKYIIHSTGPRHLLSPFHSQHPHPWDTQVNDWWTGFLK